MNEGRMNLVGQHKPTYYLNALTDAEGAWDAYYIHVENMIVMGKTGDENEVRKMNALQTAAVALDEYTQQMYHRWQREIRAEAEGIPVVMPVNVKESIDNFASK